MATTHAGGPGVLMAAWMILEMELAAQDSTQTVLLDEQDGDAFALEADQQRLEVAHEAGRQALRGLVEHHELRVAGQGARDGEHLLLAAGEAPAPLPPALAQDGEVLEDAVERPARVLAVAPRRKTEVLADVEMRKDLASFGHVAHPEPEDAVRRLAGDLAVLEAHGAGARRRQSHDRAQRRRLARAIAPEQHGDLARRHREGHVAQHVALAVEGVERVDREQHGQSRPPRYAFCTSGFARISAAVPSAIS